MNLFSRRSFLSSSTLLTFLGITGFSSFLLPLNKKKESMFVHHVFFWLKNPDSQDESKKLLKGLNDLVKIDLIQDFQVGVPAPTNREVIESSYNYSLLLIFKNIEDEKTYQDHPIHLKFVEDCSSLWSKVVVYDSINAQ